VDPILTAMVYKRYAAVDLLLKSNQRSHHMLLTINSLS